MVGVDGGATIAPVDAVPNPPRVADEVSPKAVLLLHGFTGTPFEIQPLADALSGQGYLVETPLLAGHGIDVAALEATGWQDWLASAEAAFDALAARTSGRVAVVGFSMGGLLALRLACTRADRVAALAALSVPLRLRAAHAYGIRMLAGLPTFLRRGPFRSVPKFFGSRMSDPDMRRRNPTLPAMPLASLRSLLDLMAIVRRDLATVRTSVLVAHGRLDRTVPIASSVELSDLLAAVAHGQYDIKATKPDGDRGGGKDGSTPPAPVVERLWLERSCHLVGIDVEREALCTSLAQFLSTKAQWR